jgi:formate C-acetyltransferase
MNLPERMSVRTKKLFDELIEKAQEDRSGEWFTQDMFPNIFSIDSENYGLSGNLENKPVIIRRSVATDIMLKAMTDGENSKKTRTAQICEGDLLLGILPMGSNGLGKVFPQYLTDDELRAGSIADRKTMSIFSHNAMNYEKLVNCGLKSVIEKCDEKIKQFTDNRKDFYTGVKISCAAVIDYAHRFSRIAEEESKKKSLSSERREELLRMAAIAMKVPEYPAETFHEAVQSVTFFHIALHASMNFVSLGRLDQVLNKYLEKERDKERALEIMECFLIKLAGRLNLSSDYLYEQDHLDFYSSFGTHPYFEDQKAGVNNFLQNIVIGGKLQDGQDAANEATYLILQAVENVNLATPGIYVRLHKASPEQLYRKTAHCIEKTKNNPSVINDDVMVEAVYRALIHNENDENKKSEMLKIARDFCVDGCWEPVLHGKSDWMFSMLNAMKPLETAMNQGASLSPDHELLRGAKIAPNAPLPASFEEFMDTYKTQLEFFAVQCVLSLFHYYVKDEYACVSPLFSAFLDGCMENGRDKSCGGAEFNLLGILYTGAPNVINNILCIRKWVFPSSGKGKYTLKETAEAFRRDFKNQDHSNRSMQNIFTSIQTDFYTNTPKFGEDSGEVNEITRNVLDICYGAVLDSVKFAERIFCDANLEDSEKKAALRSLAGIGGFIKENFDLQKIKFTVGMGTFEQYDWQGRGIAACADRQRGEALAPNFSHIPGTLYGGIAGLLSSFKSLELERFSGGVMTDICLEEGYGLNSEVIFKILKKAIDDRAPMFTITIGSGEIYTEIYEKVLEAGKLKNRKEAGRMLAPYACVNVRIGGWQTPFITLPLSHMENYIRRPAKLLGA